MLAPVTWVSKMAHWLPYHRDTFFLSLQAAIHGQYQPQYKEPAPETKDPETVKALANKALDGFSSRADQAIRKYQHEKAMRGR